MKRMELLLFALLVVVSSCQCTTAKQDLPARIINPTAESRAELNDLISEALNNADLTLASDALTTTSLLIIERKRHRTIQNNPVMGRDLSKPERFQLMLNNKQCVLVQHSNNKRWTLNKSHCVAE